MGIDIYAHWRNQSTSERDTQAKAWLSAADGDVGYLREAYHGEPYATKVLVPEAFEYESREGAPIPAATLRRRLRKTLAVACARQLLVYKEGAQSDDTRAVVQSFVDFVELCEAKERDMGEPCRIVASY